MTTVTHQLTNSSGQPRAGVTATLSLYSGNRYAEGASWSATAVSDASGNLSWTVPDGNHVSRQGTYYRLTAPGLADNPVIRIKPGTVSTTVAKALVGNSTATGELPDRSTPDPVSAEELSAFGVPGRVVSSTGSTLQTVRVEFVLDASGALDDIRVVPVP